MSEKLGHVDPVAVKHMSNVDMLMYQDNLRLSPPYVGISELSKYFGGNWRTRTEQLHRLYVEAPWGRTASAHPSEREQVFWTWIAIHDRSAAVRRLAVAAGSIHSGSRFTGRRSVHLSEEGEKTLWFLDGVRTTEFDRTVPHELTF